MDVTSPRNALAFTVRPLTQRNDNLVRMRNIKLAANQLVHQVGIGMTGIKPVDPVLQTITLSLDLSQFLPPLMKRLAIVTPGKNAVRTQNGIARKQSQKDDRESRAKGRHQKNSKFCDLRHG